jgi:hypothetical protein
MKQLGQHQHQQRPKNQNHFFAAWYSVPNLALHKESPTGKWEFKRVWVCVSVHCGQFKN